MSQNFDTSFDADRDSYEAAPPEIQEEIRRRASKRLASLDALRGLNMLFIIGLASLVTAICNLHSSDFQVFGDGAVRAARAFRESWIGPSPDAIAKHMEHVRWNGVLHHDTIFPLFLFLAGVSFPFSLRKQQANGRATWKIWLKALWRGIALVVLGIIYSNKVNFDFAHLRYMGVLQHIGLAGMFASFIYLLFGKRTKLLIGICAFILISYWLVVALVPAPDVAPKEAFTAKAFVARAADMVKPRYFPIFEDSELPEIPEPVVSEVVDVPTTVAVALAQETPEAPAETPAPAEEPTPEPVEEKSSYPEIGTVDHNLLPEGCFVNYLDRKFVPGKLYHEPRKWKGEEFKRSEIKEYDPKLFRDLRDPEGLASTYPAIVTALLGMIFGGILRREESEFSKWKKLGALLLGGVILLAIGYGWHFLFPINKNLWNSSFVCFVGGYSALALALFYFFIDVLPLRLLGWPFAIVGMNSITIFLAKRIVDFSNMRDFFFKDAIERWVPTSYMVGDAEVVCNAFARIATIVAGLIVSWCFLLWLYRRKIFMRV